MDYSDDTQAMYQNVNKLQGELEQDLPPYLIARVRELVDAQEAATNAARDEELEQYLNRVVDKLTVQFPQHARAIVTAAQL